MVYKLGSWWLDKKPKDLGEPLFVCKHARYRYNKISSYLYGNDIIIEFKGYRQKSRYLKIINYQEQTAYDIIRGHGADHYGRHFKECILKTWKHLDLDLGLVIPMTREL